MLRSVYMAKPRDVESIKKVAKYRKAKLSFREISRIMKKDVKTVHTWYKMGVGELSTFKPLTVGD